jgi:hypothetical protein
LSHAPRVEGRLVSESGDSFPLVLLAVDSAYPEVVCPDEQRHDAHQAWQFGQVALVEENGQVALAVPGTRLDADRACEAIRRMAKSVGAPSDNFTVAFVL